MLYLYIDPHRRLHHPQAGHRHGNSCKFKHYFRIMQEKGGNLSISALYCIVTTVFYFCPHLAIGICGFKGSTSFDIIIYFLFAG